MSARLIKKEEAGALPGYAPYALPTTDDGSYVPTAAGEAAPFAMPSADDVRARSSAPQSLGVQSPSAQLPISQPFGSQSFGHAANSKSSPNAMMMAAAAQPAAQNPVATDAAQQEVAALLDEARVEADGIIAEAERRAAEIEQMARERGSVEGRNLATEEVAAKVAQEVEPLRDRLSSTISEINSLYSSVAARAERDLVRLAIEISKKIVQREVTVDAEIALTLARVALTRLHSRTLARVHLHPDDHAYVTARREALEANGAVELIEDRSVGRGGCLVSTEMGELDARIEQQFAEVERGLLL